MTRFEKLKSMNIDELAEWLDKYGQFDGSPWMEWWDTTYCKNCPSETGYLPDDTGENRYYVPTEFAWCELHDKCRFFQDRDNVPSIKEIIKMWLECEEEL